MIDSVPHEYRMDPWITCLIGISLAAWILPCGNGVYTNNSEVINSNRICDTEACNQVADAFISSMNESMDPCVNFYEYACGNWISSNPLPVNMSELFWEAMTRFTSLAEDRLRGLLETEPSAEDILPIKQMKNMYKSCMNSSEEIEPIMQVLRETNGWPMIMNNNTWNRDAMTWQEINHYYENLLGYSSFWELNIRNSSTGHGALVIQPPRLATDFLTLRRGPIYRSVMKNLAQFFINKNNARISDEQLEKDIDDVWNFEMALARRQHYIIQGVFYANSSSFVAFWNSNARSNATQGKIDWEELLKRLLNIANLSITDETPIYLHNPYYFDLLDGFLEVVDERIIVNFIQWRFLLYISPHCPMEIRNIWSPLSSVIRNLGLLKPRWLRCIRRQDPATIHLFGREFSGNTTKIHTMITNIRKSFEFQTAKSDWLSMEAKAAIKEKLNCMKYRVGYPEWYSNETILIDYYNGLTIGDSYLENVFSLIKTYWTSQMRRWKKAMIYETYVEYGTTGRLIGHELGHSLDTHGSQFGLQPKESLFTDNMNVTLFERAQCFVDMFDKYFNGTGHQTLYENIADWYGIQATFNAYKEMRDEKYPDGELKLPKFQAFSDEKMFFISFAQGFCAASNEQIQGVTYSPNNLRVINTLSNTLIFAETFNCPKNSPMNPEEKCNIWMKPSAIR